MSNKKEEMKVEKNFTNYNLPNGVEVDSVFARVFRVRVDQGLYHGYETNYGVEVVFHDDIFSGGKYEYHHTLGIEKVAPSRIKAFYIKKVQKEEVFEDLQELIIRQVDVAEHEAVKNIADQDENLIDPETDSEKAEAALDAIEEMKNRSDEIDRELT